MDWILFGAVVGEILRDVGALVVGIVGIVATYKSGRRALVEAERQEARAHRRSVYSDYLATASEYVLWAGLVTSAEALSGEELPSAMIGRARREVQSAAPSGELDSRLARDQARVALVATPEIAGLMSDFSLAVTRARFWSNTGVAVEPPPIGVGMAVAQCLGQIRSALAADLASREPASATEVAPSPRRRGWRTPREVG